MTSGGGGSGMDVISRLNGSQAVVEVEDDVVAGSFATADDDEVGDYS